MNKTPSKEKPSHTIPTANQLENKHGLKWLKRYLYHPYLWLFTRHNVANACFIGLFVACLPMPFQMLIACIFSIIFRANVPIAIALTWISNPLTFAPFVLSQYTIGQFILDRQSEALHNLSLDYLLNNWHLLWENLLIGSMAMGLTLGIVAWLLVHIFWKMIHRKLMKHHESVSQ